MVCCVFDPDATPHVVARHDASFMVRVAATMPGDVILNEEQA
jgi:hypothetical protein